MRIAISIELWVDGRLVDGAEQWWDDIERLLVEDETRSQVPDVEACGPYGDVLFDVEGLAALAAEVRQLVPQAPAGVRTFLEKLAGLCDDGGIGAGLAVTLPGRLI
jgi:hypothetical protein